MLLLIERVQKHERGIEGPFPLDLAVPSMFPYRWERIALSWEPGQVCWEGKAQVSRVLSMGGAGARVPGLRMAPG